MQPPPADFDARIRDCAPETPSLPSNFRDRVWRTIRGQEEKSALPGWFENTFLAGISPLRLAASLGVTAILVSGLAGLWLGNISVSKSRRNLFPMLTSARDLSLLAP